LESDAQRARRRSSVAVTAAGADDDDVDFKLLFRIGNADFDLAVWVRDFDLAGGVAG
jgi:hypothetical protein